MGSSEKFCLKWNDFKTNITSSFNQIRNDPEFSDVTLACDGDQKIEAHKVILASSSQFFSKILKQNKHPHPLLYMRGVDTSQLSALVDFIYHGEVNIFQEDLDTFLNLAEELEIKGLGSSNAGQATPEKTSAHTKPLKPRHNLFQNNYENNEVNTVLDKSSLDMAVQPNKLTATNNAENALVPVDTFTVRTNTNNEELLNTVESMMEYMGQGKYVCKVCGKNANHKNNMRNHVEANHIEGATHSCNQCGKQFRSGNSLSVHLSRYHKA